MAGRFSRAGRYCTVLCGGNAAAMTSGGRLGCASAAAISLTRVAGFSITIGPISACSVVAVGNRRVRWPFLCMPECDAVRQPFRFAVLHGRRGARQSFGGCRLVPVVPGRVLVAAEDLGLPGFRVRAR